MKYDDDYEHDYGYEKVEWSKGDANLGWFVLVYVLVCAMILVQAEKKEVEPKKEVIENENINV